jgi:hypothetical protein
MYTFTVDGNHPGHTVLPDPPNSSQDTHANYPKSVCESEVAETAREVGLAVEAYMVAHGAPDGAGLLRNFLTDSGTPVNFQQGSEPSNELPDNPKFVLLKSAVLAEINSQLEQGATTVDLNGFLQARTPPPLYSPPDLADSFGGTQGMTVSGTGTVNGGSYSGTLTYTIFDSYGFSVKDALTLPFKTGAFMRYLQVNCGDDPEFGAHWFPDSVTLTQDFSGTL